jgi:peroxiredoxin
MKNLYKLPGDLPIPVDDGACNHLLGINIPSVILNSTSGANINVSTTEGLVVIFFYPVIGRPDSPPMIDWNDIPGARGCTPQSCSFRDNYLNLKELKFKVYGISSQPLAHQIEAQQRLSLPFELLNDSEFMLTKALKLPTFQYQNTTYIKRLTIITENGMIKKIFYPVFPPNEHIFDVINWAKHNKSPNLTDA